MIKSQALLASIGLLALVAGSHPASARSAAVPDHADLGLDGNSNSCVVDRYWNDPGVPDPFGVSMALTCRGTTAGRHLGVVRKVRAAQADAFEKLLECGEARDFDIPGLGRVQSRRCYDSLLDLATTETTLHQGQFLISVSALAVEQAPAEQALRLLANAPPGAAGKAVIDIGQLAQPPQRARAAADAGAPASDALDQGLRFIRAGLFAEASRVLTAALGRLNDDSPLDTRVELLLLAGLTDSNLSYFQSAEARFNQADVLLRANTGLAITPILDRKRLAYIALDQLNQLAFNDALNSLNKLTRSTDAAHPLLDPAVLVTLNQQPPRKGRDKGRGVERLDSSPDANALSQLVIDAQANWARSVILRAQGKPAEALAVLAAADVDIALLVGQRVSQVRILWLEAQVERQRARLLLSNGDQPGALAAIDRAIGALRRAEQNGEVGPVLAEAEFDRADIISHNPAGRQAAIAQFGVAVGELVTANVQGLTPPPSVANYLGLLVDDYQRQPSGPAADLFFSAIQVIADPAIARQFVALQSLVASSPALAGKKQDEQNLEREIARLGFEAADVATDPKKAATDRELAKGLFDQLTQLQSDMQRDPAYRAVSDSAASIADVRKVLQPGEAYFKLNKVRESLFGILIDHDGAVIWRVIQPDSVVEKLASEVRDSIDGGGQTLNKFDVGRANALFQLTVGPVASRLLSAKSLIVDPAGPLQQLPIGVLVADKASVKAYTATRKLAPYDYSAVDFVARHLSISQALSPRSLIVGRSLGPSSAPLPFMGFAQHMPAPVDAHDGDTLVSVGHNCLVTRKAIAQLTRDLVPINASELDRAGAALGLAKVPELTGAAFTDTAVMQMTDLDQFQVLHFATHGVTEGEWGCTAAPPALVTSFGGPKSAAILPFDEIAKLKLDANLVVLSACNTAAGISIGQARASGQEDAGASLQGLVRAFLAANARAVLSTYWPISNAGQSEDLMVDFYRSARAGTIGEALRNAQTAILTNPTSSHPFFWGAFFIVGDAQQPLLTGKARTGLALAGSTEAKAM